MVDVGVVVKVVGVGRLRSCSFRVSFRVARGGRAAGCRMWAMGLWPLARGREKVVDMPSRIVDFATSPPRVCPSGFLGRAWHSYDVCGAPSGWVGGVRVVIIRPPNMFMNRSNTKSAHKLLRRDTSVFKMKRSKIGSLFSQRNKEWTVQAAPVRFNNRSVPDEMTMCPNAKSDDVVLSLSDSLAKTAMPMRTRPPAPWGTAHAAALAVNGSATLFGMQGGAPPCTLVSRSPDTTCTYPPGYLRRHLGGCFLIIFILEEYQSDTRSSQRCPPPPGSLFPPR